MEIVDFCFEYVGEGWEVDYIVFWGEFCLVVGLEDGVVKVKGWDGGGGGV